MASEIEADATSGRAHWDATYTYSATGRRVVNKIDATFAFRDGRITRHHDRFDLHRWARQALGLDGSLLGWAPPVQRDARPGGQGARGLARARRRTRPPSRRREPAAPELVPGRVGRARQRIAHRHLHAPLRSRTAVRARSHAQIGVLLVNLGTPDAPTSSAVRRYLAQFLSDPRVVEIPRVAWQPILHGIILLVRPARSARKYAAIWSEGRLAAARAQRAAALAAAGATSASG